MKSECLKPYLKDLLGEGIGTMLELGPGRTGIFDLLGSDVTYHAIDISPRCIARLRKASKSSGITQSISVSDAHFLPYDNGSFDLVVATMFLCSVKEPARVLSEIRRVLKPGGTYCFVEHVHSACSPFEFIVKCLVSLPWKCRCGSCNMLSNPIRSIRDAGMDIDFQVVTIPTYPSFCRDFIVGKAQPIYRLENDCHATN